MLTVVVRKSKNKNMQPLTPRPSLQPNQRPTGPATYGRGGVNVPQRGAGYSPANPVDRAVVHDFAGSPVVSTSFGHFTETPKQHAPTYASATQAMFATDPDPQTPYEQQYHFGSPQNQREFHFPFRALMIVLVIGAVSFGAYAIYQSFTNPSPVNAGYNSTEVEP